MAKKIVKCAGQLRSIMNNCSQNAVHNSKSIFSAVAVQLQLLSCSCGAVAVAESKFAAAAVQLQLKSCSCGAFAVNILCTAHF